MAEEEKVDSEEQQEKEPKEEKKGFSKKRLIMIAVAVVLLGGSGFAGWKFFLTDGDGAMEADASLNQEEIQVEKFTYEMKPFIVNLLGNQGKRYLKAKIDLELGSEELKQELDDRQSQLRDAILLLLASKSFSDISNPEGKVVLRQEMITTINDILKKGQVDTLYFTEFVVQ